MVALLCLSAPSLFSQETRSMIFGRVTDPSGSSITGAKVVTRNLENGAVTTLETNSTGYYEANLLLPGSYEVDVEANGFKKAARKGIQLQIGSRVEIDHKLEMGQMTETISVTAEAPMLETNAVSSGRVMDNRTVMDLPVMGNSVMLLLRQSAGMQTGGVNNELGLHSIAGGSDYGTSGNVGGNMWMMDGVPNQGSNRRAAMLPYSDTVAEFRLETSNFDASVGQTTGAVISMTSKSGSNSAHGTATWQHWQRRWNGTPFFVKQLYFRRINEALAAGNTARANELRGQDRQPTGRSNNWAATFGGPVVIPKLFNGKNKLFFFFSYNAFKDVKTEDASSINRTIPTSAQRNGDFSQLLTVPNNPVQFQLHDPLSVRPDPARAGQFIRDPFAGNIVPRNRIQNPMAAAYLRLLPNANNDNANPESRNNYLAVGTPYNWDYWAYTNRVDYNISDRHRVFGRWSWNDFREDRGDWTYESARGLHTNGLNRNNKGASVDYVWTPAANTILNFSGGINQFREGDRITVPYQFKPTSVGLPQYMDTFAGSQNILPSVNFNDAYQTIGRGGVPVYTTARIFTTKAEVTHIRGKHSIRAGIDGRQHFRTGGGGGNTSGNFNFGTNFTRRNSDTLTPSSNLGHSMAAFLMGFPNSATIAYNDSFAMHNPWYGSFIQDSWRVTQKLTLNYGVRLEYEGGPTERFDRAIGDLDRGATLPITAAAQAAYARNPIPEVAPAAFQVRGGSRYVNAQGRPRQIWPGELMFMPRIAVAYQLDSKTVLRAGYGMYFDTLNALNEGLSQTNFSRTTSANITNDFGSTWLVGNPAGGVPPAADPFPVRADGTRFDVPTRNALGLMAVQGRGFTFNGDDIRRARQQRWRFGVQRQFGTSWVIDAAYAGSSSGRVYIDRPQNALPERYWSSGTQRNDNNATFLLANVTNPFNINNFTDLRSSNPMVFNDMNSIGFFTAGIIQRSQLLRPYPNLGGGLNVNRAPDGAVRTHEFQFALDKRFSKGWNLNLGYTGMYIRDRDIYLNEFDATPSWRPTNDGRPHRLTATGIYELPFGKGRRWATKGWVDRVAGGWQIAATYEYQPGPLLTFGNQFYYGNDVNNINTGERTFDRWFNTADFERNAARGPAAFHRRVFPTRIDGLRADMTNQWNANLQKNIQLREGMSLQLRLDALNLANRSQMAGPTLDPFNQTFGQITSQTSATNRFIQIQARIVF